MKKMLVLLVLLLGLQQEASAQEPAGASAYLVGVFDLREDRTTILHIVNPTRADLRLFVALFDDSERPLRCFPGELSANDLMEINVREVGVDAPLGVVKVITFARNEDRPQIGVVGNQRLSLGRQPTVETGLHPIQSQFLESELPVIRQLCRF
jgi:hypothetical protein